MNKKIMSFLLTLLILGLIVLLSLFFYIKFIAGPVNTYAKIDDAVFYRFKETYNIQNAELKSRIKLNELTYAAEDHNNIYLFDEKGYLKEQLSIDEAKASINPKRLEIAQPVFAIFDDNIVIVYENEDVIYVESLDKELLFKYEKRFGYDE